MRVYPDSDILKVLTQRYVEEMGYILFDPYPIIKHLVETADYFAVNNDEALHSFLNEFKELLLTMSIIANSDNAMMNFLFTFYSDLDTILAEIIENYNSYATISDLKCSVNSEIYIEFDVKPLE